MQHLSSESSPNAALDVESIVSHETSISTVEAVDSVVSSDRVNDPLVSVVSSDHQRPHTATTRPGTPLRRRTTMCVSAQQQQQQQEQITGSTYCLNSWGWAYADAAVEDRYYIFVFQGSNYLGGKLYSVIAAMVSVALTLSYYPNLFSPSNGSVVEDLLTVVTFVVSVVFVAVAFRPSLWRYREVACLATIAFQVPNFNHAVLVRKTPHRSGFAYVFGYAVFCLLLPHPRVRQCAVFFPLILIIGLALSTFATGYYKDTTTDNDRGAYIELLWWITSTVPLFVQFYMERLTRRAFEVVDSHIEALVGLSETVDDLSNAVSSLFPPSAISALSDNGLYDDTAAAALTMDEINDQCGGEARTRRFATPTFGTISSSHAFLHRKFRNTAMIVSDVVGFTSWTSRTDAMTVVQTLAMMFTAVEGRAAEFGVERIATVGDSYVGAIFNASPDDVPNAILTAIAFGLAVLEVSAHAKSATLRQRVGVHVGDVVGGFVGTSPPQFDLFGFAILFAKHMESSGVADRVHVSTEAMAYVPDDVRSAGVLVETEEGVLIESWLVAPPASPSTTTKRTPSPGFSLIGGNVSKSSVLSVLAPPMKNSDAASAEDEHNRRKLRALLHRLRQVDFYDDFNDDVDMSGKDVDETVKALSASLVIPLSDDALRRQQQQQRIAFNKYRFHPIFLHFRDDDVEEAYRASLHETGGQKEVLAVLVVFMVVEALMLTFTGCIDTLVDRLALASFLLCINVNFVFLTWGTGQSIAQHAGPITVISYGVPVFFATFLSAECNYNTEMQRRYTSHIVSLSPLIAMWAPQLVFNLSIAKKCLTLMFFGVIFFCQHWLRGLFIDDDTLLFAPFLALGPVAFVALSYIEEYSLRKSYAMQHYLLHALDTTGDHMKEMRRHLECMLPDFVVDMMLMETLDAKKQKQKQLQQDLSINVVDAVAAAKDRWDTTHFWEYPAVCILFISFHFGADAYEGVQPILSALEAVAAHFGTRKVKSVNTTMLYVSGIDGSTDGSDSVVRVLRTLTAMIDDVLASEQGVSFTAGIHCGHCMGAVIGTSSLTFDVFGDTVNTASRLQTSAHSNTVQLSSAAVDWVPSDVLLATIPRNYVFQEVKNGVYLKGKGRIPVYSLRENRHNTHGGHCLTCTNESSVLTTTVVNDADYTGSWESMEHDDAV
eukprot:PhM_4_TR17751/c0_g1_i1/m.54903